MKAQSLILLSALVTTQAFAGVTVSNGVNIQNSEHPAVVRLEIPGGSCTGTYIAADIILTAAHCVEGAKQNQTGFYSNVAVATNQGFSENVVGIRVHAIFKEIWSGRAKTEEEAIDDTFKSLATDLAVIKTTQISKHFISLASVKPALGQKLEIVGFGLDTPKPDPFFDEALKDSVRKRKGFNEVFSFNPFSLFTCNARRLDKTIHGHIELPDGENSAALPGDSGGPVLNEAGEIMGVSSMYFSEKDSLQEEVKAIAAKVGCALEFGKVMNGFVRVDTKHSKSFIEHSIDILRSVSGSSVAR